jgi:CrcB protein
MQTLLWVGIGGFIGAISRFLLGSFVQKSTGVLFPVGTLSVNLLGGFLIGFLALYFESHLSAEYRLVVITGFLGALTTFSTFSYETVMLIEHAAYLKAVGNIFLNVLLSLSATIIGMMLYKKIYL